MENYWILVGFVLGWALSQVGKILVMLLTKKTEATKADLKAQMFKSGGMPSGHTASFISAIAVLGYGWGYDTPIFALAICVALVIIYDAVNVRFAVGEQGKLLNKLSSKAGEKTLRVVEGHTLPEVLVGVLVGVAASGLTILLQQII